MESVETVSMIRTPDQRVRVFVSSTLQELGEDRAAARRAIEGLRLIPVMFEMGARPHPPRDVYRAYLEQSQIFVGIYGKSYGWIAPDMEVSGLEDEFNLSDGKPRLIYFKGRDREPRLAALASRIRESGVSYRSFETAEELEGLLANDLALLLSERFETAQPPKPIDRPRAALPIPGTPLVGREADVEACCGLILSDEVRLLSLLGPGGIGKTKLAIEVARRVEERFAAPVTYIPLAGVRDTDLVPVVLLNYLIGHGLPSTDAMQTLFANLPSDPRLLVLDNFEHLMNAAVYVSQLLEGCSGIKVIVTSREPLRIAAEHEYRVPPLGHPAAGAAGLDRSALERMPAVRLFVDRAKSVRPDFTLDDDNAEAVAEISAKLEGIPLAIELAAARVKMLSPQEMIRLLDKGIELLSIGRRDAPDRHKTLRATIDWSYSLLTDEEKRLLNRLAVFVGGCTLPDAYAVTGPNDTFVLDDTVPRKTLYPTGEERSRDLPTPSPDFIDRMESLLSKSLMRVETGVSGESRFHLYESVREYALEKLEETGEASETYARHCRYFLFAGEAEWPRTWSSSVHSALRRGDERISDVLAALHYAIQEQPEYGLRMVISLGEYCDIRQLRESTQWIRSAIDRYIEAGGRDERLINIAKLELSRRLFREEKWQEFFTTVDEVEAWAQRSGDKYIYVDAVQNRTLAQAYAFKLAEVREAVKAVMPIAEEIGYDFGKMCLLQNLGGAEAFAGSQTDAESLLEESARLAVRLGAKRRAGISLCVLSGVCFRLGKVAKGLRALRESFLMVREMGDRVLLHYSLTHLVVAYMKVGDIAMAARTVGVALGHSRRTGVGFVPAVYEDFKKLEEEAARTIGDARYRQCVEEGEQIQYEEAIEGSITQCEALLNEMKE